MAQKKLNKSAAVREFLSGNPNGSYAEYIAQAPKAAKITDTYFHNLKSTIKKEKGKTAKPGKPGRKPGKQKARAAGMPAIPALTAPRKAPPAQEVRVAYTDHQLHAARAFAEDVGSFETAIGVLKTVQSLVSTTGLAPAVID